MKPPLSLIPLIFLTFVGTSWATGGSEGGGASIVCPRNSNDREHGPVYLLDLQETIDARSRGKSRFEISTRFDLDEDIQFAAAAKRLKSIADFRLKDGTDVTAEKKNLEQNKDVGFGMKIAPPSDTGKGRAIFLPQDCELGAIGYRQKDGTLAVSQPLYDRLNPTHRAAFWMHEAIYSMVLKITGQPLTPEIGTENIRRLVALLFSSNSTQEDLARAFRDLGLPMDMERTGPSEDARYALANVFGHSAELAYEYSDRGDNVKDAIILDSASHPCSDQIHHDLLLDRQDPDITRLVERVRKKYKVDYLTLKYVLSTKYRGWFTTQSSLVPELVIFGNTEKPGSLQTSALPIDANTLLLNGQSDWHSGAPFRDLVKSNKTALNEVLQRGGCSLPKEKLRDILVKAIGEQGSSTAPAESAPKTSQSAE